MAPEPQLAPGEEARRGGLFILNGLAATGTHYVALIALSDGLGVRPVGWANFLAASLGVAVSYVGNHHFVFRSRQRTGETIWRFLGVYGAMTVAHGLAMYAWADLLSLWKTPGFVLITGATAVGNYVLGKVWVFAQRPGPGGEDVPS